MAMCSAWKIQKPESIWLVHEGLEKKGDGWDAIKDIPTLQLMEANDKNFEGLHDDGLCCSLFHTLKSPASRANLLRLALLYKEGGVYLGTDVIVVRPWNDLLHQPAFCGVEPVAFPNDIYKSINLFRWLQCGLLFAFREVCARSPHGYELFRLFEGKFYPAVNNAVLGAEPKNKLMERAFDTIRKMKPEDRLKRFQLGAPLIQKLTNNQSSPEMTVFPSSYFCPLGPEVSTHWFRKGTDTKLDDMIFADTRIVHWYNSVEERFLKTKLDRAWFEQHPDTAFAEMVRRYATK